ncbi:MAG: cobalamin-independent methionine synthase II family protein [Candidatus Hydrothermarchaeales archaeon]
MEVRNGKILQDQVLTGVVGSYPRPKYIFSGSGRELLDNLGMTFRDLEEKIGAEEFRERLDRAALMAIKDQNLAGIDIITDGEMRRDHYVLYVLRGLEGFDFDKLKRKSIRGGIYVRDLPTIVGKIDYKNSILSYDFEFTKKYADGISKISLPGPSTVVDSVADGYYKEDTVEMAMDYSKAIRNEVKNLIEVGCRIIQFDDSVMLRYPEQAEEWGLDALHESFRGFENKATFITHICRGYPDKDLEEKGIPYKANEDNYGRVLSLLSQSNIDVISIEGAQSQLDLSVLPTAGEKTIMLGVLDVGSDKVETVESLVKRGREALQYLPKERLILAPDCGMLELSPTAAKQKLVNVAAAASILNEE